MIKTQQELDQKINSLQQELEELKKIKIEEKKYKKRAKGGGKYYAIALDHFTGPKLEQYYDNYDTGDDVLFYVGNYYLTVEEGEKDVKKEFAFIRIMKYVYDNDLYFEPDWNNSNVSKKWQIIFNYENDVFLPWSTYTIKSDLKFPWFKSEEDAGQVIDNCKEDLEIYFN